jgi:hypothetical protein
MINNRGQSCFDNLQLWRSHIFTSPAADRREFQNRMISDHWTSAPTKTAESPFRQKSPDTSGGSIGRQGPVVFEIRTPGNTQNNYHSPNHCSRRYFASFLIASGTTSDLTTTQESLIKHIICTRCSPTIGQTHSQLSISTSFLTFQNILTPKK